MNEDKIKAAAVETLSRFIQAKHLRKTPERFAILDVVMSMQGHFAIEKLMERMAADGRLSVSRGTIYNTVSLLLDCGLLRRHQFSGQAPQYEAVSRLRTGHMHLICTKCGKVREVSDTEAERVIHSRRYETFQPEYFEVSIYGLCSRCYRKGRRKKT